MSFPVESDAMKFTRQLKEDAWSEVAQLPLLEAFKERIRYSARVIQELGLQARVRDSRIPVSDIPPKNILTRSKEAKMELHPQFLSKDGQTLFAVLPYEEFLALQERLADADDLLDLDEAIRAEGSEPTIPVAEAKRRLGLD